MRKRGMHLWVPRAVSPIYESGNYHEFTLDESIAREEVVVNPLPDAEGIQFDGTCALRKFHVPIIYNATVRMPRSILELHPRTEIIVRIHPDQRNYGVPELFVEHETRQIAVPVWYALHCAGEVVVSRSAEPISIMSWHKSAKVPKDPVAQRLLLNEHGWLSLGDSIEVLLKDSRSFTRHTPKTVVRHIVEHQHIRGQQLYIQEQLMERVGIRPSQPLRYEDAMGETGGVIPRRCLSDNGLVNH
jgi:hypothetical protein